MAEKKSAKKGNRKLSLYTKLMRATNTITDKMHRHLADHKLSVSQFGVLEALFNLGPLCQKELGNKLLKTSGNITMVIDNLEKRKLVIRIKDKKDRRKMTINLTEEGFSLIDRVFPVHMEKADDVFSVLTKDEIETFGQLLKKIGGVSDNTP